MRLMPRLCGAALLACTMGPAIAAAPASADEVLKTYVDAIGGSEKLAHIQTRVMEAKISLGWLSLKLKSRLIRPNRFEDEASILGQGGGSGYDGTTGWTRKGSTVTVVQGKELKRMLRGHSLDWDRQFSHWYPTRRLLPDAEIDGVKVHVVEMIADTGDREIWRFDAATGLLKQLEGSKQDEKDKNAAPVKVVSNISDYRRVDGILLAFRITGTEGKKDFSMEVLSVVHNQALDPVKFPAEE